ncbi:MAG TPA: hypothetical protein VH143_01140 [Kofleriaceae bacterium]|jgi:hypothetical protein|nr:hypothetical protein [Kofleriaceae bacterium]
MKVTHVIFAVLMLAIPARVHAQASPEAEKLFRDGRQLEQDGKLAEACAAFEASEKVEHSIATVLNLANCREKNQQLAAAWALFLAAESQTRGDPAKAAFNTSAKTRAAALEARLSYLTINVPDDSRVPDLIVTRDGTAVDPAEWNRAIPVDGGDHVIAGRAPGHEAWSTKITVAPALDKQAVEVPKFKELPKLAHPEVDAPAATPDRSAPPPATFSTQRYVSLGVGGAALAAVAIGIGLGLSANSLRDQAISTCPPSACTVANAADATATTASAHRRAIDADIAYGVGGAAAATAIALWLTGSPESAPRIVPTTGAAVGLAFTGSF